MYWGTWSLGLASSGAAEIVCAGTDWAPPRTVKCEWSGMSRSGEQVKSEAHDCLHKLNTAIQVTWQKGRGICAEQNCKKFIYTRNHCELMTNHDGCYSNSTVIIMCWWLNLGQYWPWIWSPLQSALGIRFSLSPKSRGICSEQITNELLPWKSLHATSTNNMKLHVHL